MNRFSINLWSGGEYLNTSLVYNVDYISPNINPPSVKDWSGNGDKSFKCANGTWIRFLVPITSSDVGKNVNLKAKVYVPEGTIRTHIIIDSVKTFADCTGLCDVSLTTEIPEGQDSIQFNFQLTDSTLLYVDSLECIIE